MTARPARWEISARNNTGPAARKLAQAATSLPRDLAYATSNPELRELKDQVVTVNHRGTEVTGRCTGVGYTRQGTRLVGYWMTVLAPQGEVRLDVADLTVVAVAPVELPACTAFVGAGQRCTACRVRKAMHA